MSGMAARRDLSLLIGDADVDAALASGEISREKIQGKWLYLTADAALDDALNNAEAVLTDGLAPWLVNPAPYLIGAAARDPRSQSAGKDTLTLLAHELCARGRLLGLPLLTQHWQPYLAFYAVEDRREIERQVAGMRDLLEDGGSAHWRQLPDPLRPVARKAWRTTVIAHGEWLGLGWCPAQGELVRW